MLSWLISRVVMERHLSPHKRFGFVVPLRRIEGSLNLIKEISKTAIRYEIYLTLLIMSYKTPYKTQISVDNVWYHLFVFFYVQAPTLKMTKDLVFPTKKWAKFSAW